MHSSPKSTGLRGKIGMIRCVFLRSTNVSVVSNIVVTEMIEKIHPRHFLNLSCEEKIEFWARGTSALRPERIMTQEPLEIWKSGDFLEVEMVPMREDGDDASSSNLWHLRILAALRSDTSST